MVKNEQGFGFPGYILVLLLAVIISVTGWSVYQSQKTSSPKNNNPEQSAIKDEPASQTASDNKLTVDPDRQDNRPQVYAKPTAPTGLKATPSGSGYNLTWNASIATGTIANYQVFYQGNKIAEPTATSYQHNLPPPLPGCKPTPLTYYVKAVDNEGSLSNQSDSLVVQFGGC